MRPWWSSTATTGNSLVQQEFGSLLDSEIRGNRERISAHHSTHFEFEDIIRDIPQIRRRVMCRGDSSKISRSKYSQQLAVARNRQHTGVVLLEELKCPLNGVVDINRDYVFVHPILNQHLFASLGGIDPSPHDGISTVRP
jgi:hypothetical protein